MNNDRIPDLSDLATAHEERLRAAALSVRKPNAPAACGRCLNCETPLPEGHRWCDASCRDDWEKFEAAGVCQSCED